MKSLNCDFDTYSGLKETLSRVVFRLINNKKEDKDVNRKGEGKGRVYKVKGRGHLLIRKGETLSCKSFLARIYTRNSSPLKCVWLFTRKLYFAI